MSKNQSKMPEEGKQVDTCLFLSEMASKPGATTAFWNPSSRYFGFLASVERSYSTETIKLQVITYPSSGDDRRVKDK